MDAFLSDQSEMLTKASRQIAQFGPLWRKNDHSIGRHSQGFLQNLMAIRRSIRERLTLPGLGIQAFNQNLPYDQLSRDQFG